MRRIAMLVVLVAWVGVARADRTLVKKYAGQVVISPDPVPTEAQALAAFVRANVTKDGAYELIDGPPWEINLVGFLSKDPGKRPVELVFADAADPKAPPLAEVEVSATHRIVIGKVSATVAAGFAARKPYLVRLMLGKTVLAHCTLTLRD